MNRFRNWFFALALVPAFCAASPEAGRAAVGRLKSTDSRNVTQSRLDALSVLQEAADGLTPKAFAGYRRSGDEEARRMEQESPTLYYYNDAFDRVLSDVKSAVVPEGSAMIWHIYNMGYVIRTPKQCFGIDLYHRRAAELAPYLDFILVTHSHGDHVWKPLFEAMEAAGKPVVTNFRENKWKFSEPRRFRFGEAAVRTLQADHNRKLLKFVNIYEIDCGPSAGDCVILHTGDACDPAQFEVEKPVDIFIPHIRVGMNIENAAKNYVKPGYILMSHVLELGHAVGNARWTYENGLGDCRKVLSCENVWMPVWGEKFIWNGDGRSLAPAALK